MEYQRMIELAGILIDSVGVCVIVVGALYAIWGFLTRRRDPRSRDNYTLFRQNLGKSILLGLEFLVAGDIIRTVAVSPTLANVVILGLIVLIRSFLSYSLEMEMEGRWPWQRV